MLDFEAVDKYLDKEIQRLLPLTDFKVYEQMKSELDEGDAGFQFGKHCGYFSALHAIKRHIKSLRQCWSTGE